MSEFGIIPRKLKNAMMSRGPCVNNHGTLKLFGQNYSALINMAEGKAGKLKE